MYHIGVWRQRAARAKISPCQLVNKWEREDDGQIRVLISFHQLWMPAELKVNIWGFSRCLESMDWLVLAAPLSVFVGRPGPISNVSQPHLSSYLDKTTIHYTPFLFSTPLPPPLSPAFLFSSRDVSAFSLYWSRYVTLWALSHLVTHGVSYLPRLRKCLLRDKRRWVIIYDNTKDNCVLILTGRFAISFQERMQAEAQHRRKLLFWLEIREHKYWGKVQKVKVFLFSIGHLFTAIFKVVHYWSHLYFSFQRCSQKTL